VNSIKEVNYEPVNARIGEVTTFYINVTSIYVLKLIGKTASP